MRHLLAFAPNFELVVFLWPLAALVLTLPILAYLYHRDGRLRIHTFVASYLAVAYVLSLACFTLYPLPEGASGPGITYGIPPQTDVMGFVADVRKHGSQAVFQILANVAFFVPLGLGIGLGLRKGFLRAVVVGLLTSLLIEVTQLTGVFGLYHYAYRCFDVDDLIFNTLGAVIGWLLAALLVRVLPEREMNLDEPTRHPGFVRRCVAMALDLMLTSLISRIILFGACVAFELTGHQMDSAVDYFSWMWLAAFAWVQLMHPLLRGGCTPGGAFVRMSCDTVGRTGLARLVFHVVRAAVLYVFIARVPILLPVLLVFYLFARRMPYDFLLTRTTSRQG